MTAALRSTTGIVLAALIALSIVSTTVDAATAAFSSGYQVRDPDREIGLTFFKPRPIGRLGVTWE